MISILILFFYFSLIIQAIDYELTCFSYLLDYLVVDFTTFQL